MLNVFFCPIGTQDTEEHLRIILVIDCNYIFQVYPRETHLKGYHLVLSNEIVFQSIWN
jgi:hypothetical protein